MFNKHTNYIATKRGKHPAYFTDKLQTFISEFFPRVAGHEDLLLYLGSIFYAGKLKNALAARGTQTKEVIARVALAHKSLYCFTQQSFLRLLETSPACREVLMFCLRRKHEIPALH